MMSVHYLVNSCYKYINILVLPIHVFNDIIGLHIYKGNVKLTHQSDPDSRGEFDGFSKNKIFSTKQTLLNVHMMGVEGELLY